MGRMGSLAAALLLGTGLPKGAAAAELSLEQAVLSAWQRDDGLAAGADQVRAAEADARAARDGWLPALAVSARAVATDEPMNDFGMRLDEQRITSSDFAPARLNAPSPVGGVGIGAAVSVPLYAGGRLSAAGEAALARAGAEAKAQRRRKDELAIAVVRAYFESVVAADGVRYADDELRQAQETERFVRARNEQGLLLDADVARAAAFRAEAEAGRIVAAERLASARSALALLAGDEAADAELTSAIAPASPPPAEPSPEGRPDLEAARLDAEAARASTEVARSALLPEVSAQAGVETLRSAFDQGATWFSLGLVARWQLALPAVSNSRAAEARSDAAAAAWRHKERQARREVDEARRAVAAADARVASAHEAVAASEAARALRLARHRQGLLPLTDLLDAEAGLTGARNLLLASELEARLARAGLELALGQPIEGVRS